MTRKPFSSKELSLIGSLTVFIIIAIVLPHTEQYAHYHNFADQRTFFNLHYAMDVLSNVLFLIMGIWGLIRIKLCGDSLPRAWRFFCLVFFAGFVLTFLGSSWYHLFPIDSRLVVDRLGMAVIFAGLLGLSACERISTRAGFWVLLVLLLGSVASLWIWRETGNFSPWAVVQAGGMLMVLWLACLKQADAKDGSMPHTALGIVILWYALAKVCELFDHNFFLWSHSIISGHSLKHLIAACAALPILKVLKQHRKI